MNALHKHLSSECNQVTQSHISTFCTKYSQVIKCRKSNKFKFCQSCVFKVHTCGFILNVGHFIIYKLHAMPQSSYMYFDSLYQFTYEQLAYRQPKCTSSSQVSLYSIHRNRCLQKSKSKLYSCFYSRFISNWSAGLKKS